MEKPVTGNDLTRLRNSGLLTNNEVALIVGDVVIAENVITKAVIAAKSGGRPHMRANMRRPSTP